MGVYTPSEFINLLPSYIKYCNSSHRMKKRQILLAFVILFMFPTYAWETTPKAVLIKSNTHISFKEYSLNLYESLNDKTLKFDAFEAAMQGYLTLIDTEKINNEVLLTVVDFSKSSNEERLFVIDTKARKIVYKSLVAHGRNSGYEFATRFSNKVSSFQSSLGFYKTAETYSGKHGFSLRLDGLETSNSNARSRAIVIHGADYVSQDFIRKNGKLGRSLGCPSLPKKNYKQIINTIKNGTCLFIYAKKDNYLKTSKLVNSKITSISS